MEWVKGHIRLLKLLLVAGIAALLMMAVAGLLLFMRGSYGGRLYITPAIGTLVPNSEVVFSVHEENREPVSEVWTAVGYDTTQLQFIGFRDSDAFPDVTAPETVTPGQVLVRRSTGADRQVTGDNSVVGLRFKVLATKGKLAVSLGGNSVVYNNHSNYWNDATKLTGAVVTVNGAADRGNVLLEPANITTRKGGSFSLLVTEDSGTQPVSSVESVIDYDPGRLRLSAISDGSVFTLKSITDTARPGKVRLVRALPLGSGGVGGRQQVATLTFTSLTDSAPALVTVNGQDTKLKSVSGNRDILTTTGAATVTTSRGETVIPNPQDKFSLQPFKGEYTTGSTVTMVVRDTATSTSPSVISVRYPTDMLQYAGSLDAGALAAPIAVDSRTGMVTLTRNLATKIPETYSAGILARLQFKAIASAGTAMVTASNGGEARYTISAPRANCSSQLDSPPAPSPFYGTYTSMELSWASTTADAGSCPHRGYHILRDGVVIADVISGYLYEDAGLIPGTTYRYSVQTFDAAGRVSDVSPVAVAHARADNMAPRTPAGLVASTTPGAIRLSWQQSADLPVPGGSKITGYNIYRDNAVSPTFMVAGATGFTDTSVAAKTSHAYSITAVDAAGNESPPSAIATAQASATLKPVVITPVTVASYKVKAQELTIAPYGPEKAAKTDRLSGEVMIAPAVLQSDGISRVEYYADGTLLATTAMAPYSQRMLTTTLLNGGHKLEAKVYFINGTRQSLSKTITTTNPASLRQSYLWLIAHWWQAGITVLAAGVLFLAAVVLVFLRWRKRRSRFNP